LLEAQGIDLASTARTFSLSTGIKQLPMYVDRVESGVMHRT